MKKLDFFDLKLCEKIGRMFEYAVSHDGLDIFMFTKQWLVSDTFHRILEWDVPLVSQSHTYILNSFQNEIKGMGMDLQKSVCMAPLECIYWGGYIFTYWCIWEEISGEDIVRAYKIDEVISNAYIYHSLSVKTSISMIKDDFPLIHSDKPDLQNDEQER